MFAAVEEELTAARAGQKPRRGFWAAILAQPYGRKRTRTRQERTLRGQARKAALNEPHTRRSGRTASNRRRRRLASRKDSKKFKF